MKRRWKMLVAVTMALVLNVTFASAALAHGGVPDGHAGPEQVLDVDWSFLLLPPEYVLGGVALFGMLYAVTRLRGKRARHRPRAEAVQPSAAFVDEQDVPG